MDLHLISDDAVCKFLASQIRAARLQRKFSQSDMAAKTGIALRTYKRIELGGNGSIVNLIVILRTLDRLAAIKLLLPSSHLQQRVSIVERITQVAIAAKKRTSK
ncbi:helix-turn-helix domain-containing protein [Sideroxyarcus sp. TK5]